MNTPTKPRQIDPEILKLRAEHHEKVIQLRAQQASEKSLAAIKKRIESLLPEHRLELFHHLDGMSIKTQPSTAGQSPIQTA